MSVVEHISSVVADPAPDPGEQVFLLCAAAETGDATDKAILRLAAGLADPAAKPVLLLDLGQPANRFWRGLARTGRLLPRPSAPPPSAHTVTLLFHRLRDSNVMISQMSAEPESLGEGLDLQHSGARARLAVLFSRVLLVPPSFGLDILAPQSDAAVLLLRTGRTTAAQAIGLRDRVVAAGGWPAGSVMI